MNEWKQNIDNNSERMRANFKFIALAFGLGLAVLLLAGCHAFGGHCSAAPSGAPVVVAAAPAITPPPVIPLPPPDVEQPHAPTEHQH